MREISQETQEILKSQLMIGQNKFSYQLMLEGTDYYSDIKEIKNVAIANGSSDYCVNNDGKILIVYSIGNDIYFNTVSSEEVLLTVDYVAIQDGQYYTTITGALSGDNLKLTRFKDGSIMLVISEYSGTGLFKVSIHKSQTGKIKDFVFSSIVYTRQATGTITSVSNSITKIVKLTNNHMVLFGNFLGDSYNLGQFKVFKSTDNGVTWVNVYSVSATLYRPVYQLGTIYIEKTGLIIGAIFDGGTGGKVSFIYSENDGINWNNAGGGSTVYPYSIANDLHNVYILENNQFKKRQKDEIINFNDFMDFAKFEIIHIGELAFWYNTTREISISPKGNLHIWHGSTNAIALIRDIYSAPIKASNISISKGKGGANSLSLSIDNGNGAINPKNPESALYGMVNLNKQIIVKQGYGLDLIETFTGLIDSFSMKSWPHTMEISCRDHLKKALDQIITEQGSHTVNFEAQAIESIFGYLCYLGGIETGEIDTTGISISKEFSWQTYADAFQFLADLASFDYGADEYGKIYFKRDYQPDEIFIAYTFEEGLDITSLSYQLEDKDLYYMVKVYGKSGENVISYSALFPDAAKYNILPQKILKVDATEASTIAELRMIADRSIYLMNSRTAIVNFAAVAVPWLQVGDFIQVNESSSMSAGIYRISSLNLKMTDKDFTMDLQCYYYGDSIEVGTLPEDTATQAGNASLNLIPEMTSNTAPSGVARASSVLTLYDNDYGPWNALNSTSDDLYWNAVSQYGWIEYQFTEKTIIDKYMLKARQALDYNKAMPKNWTFEGFDGAKWIVLDTKSNQTAWQIHEERSFDFTNTIAYAKYRLNVSANNGFHRLQLEQLAMYYRGGA